MEKVIWGFIGCGDVAEVKSGPAFYKINKSEVKTVFSRRLEKASTFAERHDIPQYTNDIHSLFKDNDINAIYIATPPGSHLEYAKAALLAGKHVYIEKPLATNYKDALEIERISIEQNLKAFAAYYRRSLPYFLKVRELIENFEDKVSQINIVLSQPPKESDYTEEKSWRLNIAEAGGGYLFDLASHQFDYLYDLFGEVKVDFARVKNLKKLYDVEDYVTCNFSIGNTGIQGLGIWDFANNTAITTEYCDIITSKEMIRFSFFEPNPIELYKNGIKVEEFLISHPEHVQQSLIQEVINDMLGKKACSSTVSSGKYANKVLDEIMKFK